MNNNSGYPSQVSTAKILKSMFIVVFVLGVGVVGKGQQCQPLNTINTIAGGGATPSQPLDLDLPGPTSVVKDGAGNLYIAPPASAYVFELLASGTVQNYTGKGYGGLAGIPGAVGSATVGAPTGMAIDNKGNIYFSDVKLSRIFEVSNGTITVVAGTGIKCDDVIGNNPPACGDGGPAAGTGSTAELNIPTSIAVDAIGNIYIADTVDNRIRVVNPNASTETIAGTSVCAGCIATIVGDGSACSISTNRTCGDGGPASAAEVNQPQGVFVDAAGNIYIADTHDQEIREIAGGANGGSGTTINPYAGQMGADCPSATSGCGDGRDAIHALLRLPQGIYIDSSFNGYIADTGDAKIRFVNGNGVISTIAGTGTQGFFGDNGPAVDAFLNLPASVYVDSNENIYVSDTGNQRIREFTNGGDIQTVAGGPLGNNVTAQSIQLADPYSVAEDAVGNVYFSDQANNVVRKLTNNGCTFTVSTVAGTGIAGYSGDSGSPTAATLNSPGYIALDNFGNLYITDTNNLVIRQVNLNKNMITTVAGTGLGCAATTINPACGDGGLATAATFTTPLGLAVDSSGNLYIGDPQGYRVRAVNMGTSSTTIAGITIGSKDIQTIAGTGARGDCSFNNTCGRAAVKTWLNHPSGVAVDSTGNVYVADQWNNAVRVITTAGILNPYALDGKPGPMGDGGPALKAAMWNPLLVTLDPAGDLFISGGNDFLVQRVDVLTTSVGGPNEIGTVAGTASEPTQGGFSGDGGPATAAKLSNSGSSVDASGNLYIADAGSNRIRYVPLAPAGTASGSTLALGTWPLNTPVSKALTFTSTGGAELSLNSTSISGADSGEFSQVSTCGTPPLSMGPDASCEVTVTFTPSAYGAQTATLNFADNAANTPQQVTLNGSGPDFSISASPDSITLAQGSEGTPTISLTPVAKFNQQVTLSVSGCPTNASCTLAQNQVTLTGGSVSTDVLTMQTESTTPAGTYTVTVTAMFQNLMHSSNITLQVNP